MRLKFKLGDVLIIIVIVVTALLMLGLYIKKDTVGKTAVITQNNVVLKRIRLDQLTERFTMDYAGQYPGTLEAENGSIRFSYAECPDQVCVHTGWISRPGQIAVCLPAGVIVKIEGESDDMDILVK